MFRTFTAIALISSTVLASGLAAPAMASDRVPTAARVATHDIDFNKPSDLRKLYGRIKSVAHDVCLSQGVSDPLTRNEDAACERQAVADAIESVGNAQLLAMHERATGASVRLASAR